jgi:hypothetical protein
MLLRHVQDSIDRAQTEGVESSARKTFIDLIDVPEMALCLVLGQGVVRKEYKITRRDP